MHKKVLTLTLFLRRVQWADDLAIRNGYRFKDMGKFLHDEMTKGSLSQGKFAVRFVTKRAIPV
jgi:hypothetical protein